MTGVDVVVRKGLVHVLVDVQPVHDDRGVLVREEIVRQSLLADLLWERNV